MSETSSMKTHLPRLENSWQAKLESEFEKDYMENLQKFLISQKESRKIIYPECEEYFAAMDLTPFDKVKVVIIGQDPYHGVGQAHGLSFSVREGVRVPPSLANIFKELHEDLGLPIPKSGDLTSWAKQGVLLLNAVLTVEGGRAAAHQGKGWEQFTDQVIVALDQNREHLVYILWGSYAQKKAAFVDRTRNLVLESSHPSPLSSYRGFFGSRPFSKANKYLGEHGVKEIDWSL